MSKYFKTKCLENHIQSVNIDLYTPPTLEWCVLADFSNEIKATFQGNEEERRHDISQSIHLRQKKFFQIRSQHAKIYLENITTYTWALGLYSFTSTIQSAFVVSLDWMNFYHTLKGWHLYIGQYVLKIKRHISKYLVYTCTLTHTGRNPLLITWRQVYKVKEGKRMHHISTTTGNHLHQMNHLDSYLARRYKSEKYNIISQCNAGVVM